MSQQPIDSPFGDIQRRLWAWHLSEGASKGMGEGGTGASFSQEPEDVTQHIPPCPFLSPPLCQQHVHTAPGRGTASVPVGLPLSCGWLHMHSMGTEGFASPLGTLRSWWHWLAKTPSSNPSHPFSFFCCSTIWQGKQPVKGYPPYLQLTQCLFVNKTEEKLWKNKIWWKNPPNFS